MNDGPVGLVVDQSATSTDEGAQDVYRLSPLQEGILFHHLLNQHRDTYVLSILFELDSHAHVDVLVNALQKVIARHDILRTAVRWQNLTQPVQIVFRQATLPVEKFVLDGAQDTVGQLKQWLKPERERMDLQAAPLMRLRIAADPHSPRWYAVLQVHHIACDHQSLRVVVAETLTCINGGEQSLPAPVPFRSYVAQAFTTAESDAAQEFFRRKLGDVDEPTAPFGLLDVHRDGLQVDEASHHLELSLARRIRTQARQSEVSTARLFHAAWGLVVARTSSRDDIVYGTVLLTAQQRSARAHRMLGLSVNTLPLRLSMQELTAAQLVERTHAELTELLKHEAAALTLAQRCSGLRGAGPLFTSILNYRHTRDDQDGELATAGGVRVLARGEAWTNYPVTLTIDDLGEGFIISAKVDRSIGAERMIGYLRTALESLVEALASAPQTPALALPILPAAERRSIIEEFNATGRAFPAERLIHELFERQVERTPQAVAVTHGERSLTYSELNGRANQLARYLRERGVGPDQLVGLCVERSVEMLVALLAVLKAGGAYVPLDPMNPPERLKHVLSDANPLVLLTQEKLRGRLRDATQIVTLDGDWPRVAEYDAQDLSSPPGWLDARNLAYVIYTSGSTGTPKGVMVEHRNLVNYTTHVMREFDVAAGNGSLLCTSISFDLVLTGLYPTLLCGKTVRLCRERDGLPLLAEELLRCADLAPLKLTPSHLSLLDQPLRAGQLAGCVRTLVLGGEQLQAAAVQLWRRYAPNTRIFNHYGPTETTVGCVVHEIKEEGAGTVPIGRPISNTRAYILDSRRNELPVGVIGEIFIAGAGVTRGYLNHPQLTAQRYIHDSISTVCAERLYRTGDLGRWCADGTIEYLGRNDHQLKIRGHRIEPGEIEAHVLRHEQVKEAIVLAREEDDGNKRLVAYVVLRAADDVLRVDSLRAHLRQLLPDYMVPSAFVTLERMPLTPNGKLDRRALPSPDVAALSTRQYEPPIGEVETILADIWQQLLHVERVGRHDNFFELGGHSLLILQTLEKLRQAGLRAEVRRVFEHAVLADLASALTDQPAWTFEVPPNRIPEHCDTITPDMLPLLELQQEHIERIVQQVPGGIANVQDVYPLAPLQEGILFLHLLNEERSDPYLVPMVLCVSSRSRLDELIAGLQKVVDRHDVLRTAILWDQLPRPVQVVYRRIALPVEEIALPAGDADGQMEEWLDLRRQNLDLRTAPLLRLRVAADARSGHWYVLLLLHHIVCDYTSRDIVTAEVLAQLQRRAEFLPPSIPYRNHVAQALAYTRTHEPEAFFRRKLGDVNEPTAPFGLLNVHGDGRDTTEATEELEASLSQRARLQARRASVSVATLFHAAWALVVACASRRDDVVFGTVLLGRMQASAGTQRILGMFINTLPLRLRLQGATPQQLLEQTHRELIELLEHEQASLAVAQRCSGVTGSGPLFTALLNYRHAAPNRDRDWSDADGIRMLARRARTNYPLVLSVDDIGDGFRLWAQTDRRVDARRIVSYVQAALLSMVDALERDAQTPALSLSILPEDERREVIEAFNATQASYPRDRLTHELFEQQAQRTPHATAAVYEDEALTYADLNRRANRLAHHLRDRGVMPGDFVPVVMERSLSMLIAHLAVLKCGAVYVPVDPELPAERRAFMILDCGARCALTAADRDWGLSEQCLVINCAALTDATGVLSDDNVRVQMDSSAASYVMYTSGSTGVPKGVVVPHNAVNRLALNNGYVAIGPGDCIAHHSNPAFDASTFEIWGALLNGARVVLVPQAIVLEPRQFAGLLRSQQVTILYMSAGLFNQYTDALAEVFAGLRCLLVGGESLEPGTIRRVLRGSPPRRLLNAYGPTEGTTFATTHAITDVPEGAKSIPIGRPISNAQIYILDANRQPLPIGVVGEMYVAGDGVATGYLNRPQLTAERFVADPFSAKTEARMYRTGDLAYWRDDGTIEFLGRNDHQVKIRGFRIEPGEIEARLAAHGGIGEVVVLAREDTPGEKRLVAYFVPLEPSNAPSVEELREHLRGTLPEYMLPSAFVALDSMPLTSTGKVNRSALPAPALTAYASRCYQPPQGEVESFLASVWQRVLGVERVGREDNFFEIGGHSLLALKAMFEVNRALTATLKVADAYKSPTLRELAARIAAGVAQDHPVDLLHEAALAADIIAKPRTRSPVTEAILLTGATGFVGRFLLAQLLEDTKATVYCLVRASSAAHGSARIRRTLAHWGLWREEFATRIVAVSGDLRLPNLGIDALTYRTLAHDVDAVYHCATSMNHLETYQMAKAANVESCRELLRLAIHYKPKLINFISTLGVFSSQKGCAHRVVYENSFIDHEQHWNSRGYVASKWVGEKIFMTASERGIPCNIFRLGLVWADAQAGRYDELQREYRILKSCLLAGIGIADYRHDMCPTPVDYVARSVVHLGERHRDGSGLFHISSTHQAIDGLFECYNETAEVPLQLIPFYDWIREMRQRHYDGDSLPVVPLIEFAFAMDEEAFLVHRRSTTRTTRCDCARTQRELERAGIVAPVMNEDLLRLCVDDMCARDSSVRDALDSKIAAVHGMAASIERVPALNRMSP